MINSVEVTVVEYLKFVNSYGSGHEGVAVLLLGFAIIW